MNPKIKIRKFGLSRHGKGQAVLEYMLLTAVTIIAFLLLQRYVVQSFSGRWKTSGESFGSGKLYDPHKTVECVYDFRYYNVWYDVRKFESAPDCLTYCYSDVHYDETACKNCIQDSRTTACTQ